jgi:hypothetical protein
VNVPLTSNPGVQQMPSVAVDPNDPSHIVVAYLDYSLLTTGYAGIGVAASKDGGATWQHTSVTLPAGFDQGAATPIAQFDTQGHVFISFAAATFLGSLPPVTDPNGGAPVALRALGFQADNGIFVARSDDGGLTWNAPATVASHLYDGANPVPFEIKPDLAIDTFATLPNGQPNPNYGNLYEVWSRYYPPGQFPGEPTAGGGSNVLIAVSHDAGQNWQIEPQPVAIATDTLTVNTGEGVAPGTGFANWGKVAVGPEGDVYVAQGSSGVSVYHSTDAGAHFSQPDVSTGAYFPFGSLLNALPSLTLTNDQFRTQAIRDIAADPTRPGTLYVVVSVQVNGGNGNSLDPGDILFARSTDYGATWQTTFQVGPYKRAGVLNDDNFGHSSTGAADVADGQALPRLVTDAQGDVAVIWYDTRRDPADTLLDVYGTISTDGGHTFSPNFRVTDQSFNPNLGAFTDATGKTDYYMGDDIGLVLSGGTAYAAWTDTRDGNQDVFFTSFPISPPPPPPSNRFGPNATAATATDLGTVVARSLPKLTIAASDEEWFRLQAAATGSLTVTASLTVPADSLRLELYDAGGTTLLASGSAVLNADGEVIGQSIVYPGQSGQSYLVRVLPGPAATAAPAVYTLDVKSLTADLGSRVNDVEDGNLAKGQDDYYALSVPASGSLNVTLTPGTGTQGNFRLELLDANDLSVLATGQAAGASLQANLTLTESQPLYIHVFGDATAQGDFSLAFVNLDQFTTPDNQTLFFPTGGSPSQVVVADVNRDGKPDLVVDYADQNFVGVLLNNGDGTFQAPRDFAVGPFQAGNNSTLGGVPDDKRAMVVADFTGNGVLDVAVLNYQADDISLLMGRGDGTFDPQRVIGLGSLVDPFALAAGNLTNDGHTDLVVVSSTGGPGQQGEVLLGRGDGTFEAPLPFTIPFDPGFPTNTIQIADLNHDGKKDLVYEGFETYVLLGQGDGTFQTATAIRYGVQGGLVVTDLNGDGNPDIVSTAPTSFADGAVLYELGDGHGNFQQPQVQVLTGQAPIAVALADLGRQVTLADGSTVLGPPDGIPDLVVANNGITGNFSSGPPDVVIVPALTDKLGHFDGFGSPFVLAAASSPLDLKVADLTGSGSTDVVVAETGGIEIIYGKPLTLPPNTTPATARNLGTVVHLAEPTQTIVPGHEDSYYTLTVPTEAARGAGDELLDFSGLFQGIGGAGLAMEVTDANGRVLGAGERFRISAPQGAVLGLHVFGVPAFGGGFGNGGPGGIGGFGNGGPQGNGGPPGTGAYTLDIDVLPQVVSIAAQALLPSAGAAPGGPTTSLVITLQGDRLDLATAEDPSNYTVVWHGPNGDQVIPLAAGQSVVYDSSSNVDVASGLTYPTAVRQTVTLLFDQPLPAGSYQIELSSAIQAELFNAGEPGELSAVAGFNGHPVASRVQGAIVEGYKQNLAGLVSASEALGSLAAWQNGTPFLSQLHDDLNAILDAQLTARGDSHTISPTIDNQVVTRVDPAVGAPGERPVGVLVIWLDPVVADLDAGKRGRLSANPQTDSFQNSIADAYASVAGNVELFVLAFVPTEIHNYLLTVDASPAARGGIAYFGPDGNQVQSLTTALRDGVDQFPLSFGGEAKLAIEPAVEPAAAPNRSSGNPSGTASDPIPDAVLATQALASLSLIRIDAPPLTPLASLSLADVSGGAPGAVAAVAAAAAAPAEVVLHRGSGGASGPTEPDFGFLVKRLVATVRQLGRTFPDLARSVGRWLRSFAVPLLSNPERPAPRPPVEMGQSSPKIADEARVAAPAPPITAPEENSPRPVGLSLAAVLGLLGGYVVHRHRSRRGRSADRGDDRPTRHQPPRRHDHAG